MSIIYKGKVVSGGGNGAEIPAGLISIWYGSIDTIPDGWALCDGNNGTPDLRARFVLGAGTKHSVGETGGEEEVTLTAEQMPMHSHYPTFDSATTGNYYSFAISAHHYGAEESGYFEADPRNLNGYIYHTGEDQPHNNMPPYYALCYIMKL